MFSRSRFPEMTFTGSGAATRVVVTLHGRSQIFDLFGQDAERIGHALAPCSFAEAFRFFASSLLLGVQGGLVRGLFHFRQAFTHRIRFVHVRLLGWWDRL